MDNKKKFLLLITAVATCIMIYTIVQIYAKYLTSAEGDASINIANWNILVNNVSINSGTDITNTLSPIFPGTQHIASDIIAPTAEGYFDLNLDYTNVDVSFTYNISLEVSQNSSVQDLVVYGYKIDDGTLVPYTDTSVPITDTIPYGANPKTRKITVFVKWNDDASTQTMANAADTAAAASGVPAAFNVTVGFTQITQTPSP